MSLPIVVVGLNHGSAPVELRERLAVSESRLPAVLADVLAATGLAEALLLATCNRVEVWGVEQSGDAAPAVTGWLAARAETPPGDLAGLVYVRRGTDALAHMASVAAGLDSMVVGEPQILGQVKEAHAAAVAAGAVGPRLGDVVSQVFRIAKRVRTETEVGRGAISISYAAVELARKIFGELRERSVLLLGAGEMGGLAARHLADLGVSRLLITSRTMERAEAMARETGGKAVPLLDFPRHAATADILICAAAAPGVLVTHADVAAWVASRPRPLFIIDLGVPRNVDRAAARLADVYLYDIDDLEGVVEANRQARGREVERARALIADAVARAAQGAAARTAQATIRSLRVKVEELRVAEVERAVARLGERGPDVRGTLDAMTTALVNKILHGPMEQLRAAQTAPGGARLRALVRELFGLEREEDAAEERQEER